MVKPHVAVGLVVVAFATFFGAGLPLLDSDAGYAGLSPRTVPILVTAGLAICGLWLLVRPAALGRHVDAPPDGDTAPGKAADGAPIATTVHRAGLAWVAGGLLAETACIGMLGFVIASTILMVCVARGYGSRRPLHDAAIALAITVPLWALFTQVLGITLPLVPILGI
jgi:putative tricarboxylic transport membrane protein